MRSLFQNVTSQIVSAIETGAGEYRMPWQCRGAAIALPANALSHRPYRGINVLLLWAAAQQREFATGRWATFQQWLAAGARVRKGEKATSVVLWKPRRPTDDAEASNDEHEGSYSAVLARTFHLFNSDQVEGAPEPPPATRKRPAGRRGQRFFFNLQATVEEGGDRACYLPSRDTIIMPSFEQFRNSDAYYSVLSHELTHWSGAKSRLNRDLNGRFGSEAYAMEELVAELGAAFICAHLGLQTEPRSDHAPYIASWLQVLKRDGRAIFTAAAQAQVAADYLIQLAEGERPDPEATYGE